MFNYDAIAFLCSLSVIVHTTEALKCVEQLSSCSCVTDADGGILDLSPLDNQAMGRPPFFVQGDNGYSYIYNPCSSIERCDGESVIENGAAGCKYIEGLGYSKTLLGIQRFVEDISTSTSDEISILYPGRAGAAYATFKSVLVRLACDPNEYLGRLELLYDGPPSTEHIGGIGLRLNTRYACPPFPHPPSTSNTASTKMIMPPNVMVGYVVGIILIVVCFILILGIIVLCVMLCSCKARHRPRESNRTERNSANRTASEQRPSRRGPVVVTSPHPADRTPAQLSPDASTPREAPPEVPIGFVFSPPSYDTVLLMKEMENHPPGAYLITPSQSQLTEPTLPIH